MLARGGIGLAFVLLFLLAAPAAAETEAEVLAEVKKLTDEGRKWFNVSGNTDLDPSERNKARVKAYVPLRKAYKLLDVYLEEHPERIDALEDRMVKIHMMIYWIRKESPLGLLPRDPEDDPEEEEKPKPPPPVVPPTPGPKPELPGSKPPTPRPHTPKPPTPAPAEVSAKEVFEKIASYERTHPADIAGVLARYRAFLARFPDPDSPLFKKALERTSVLSTRLKEAYRELRNEDPDTLDAKRLLTGEERKLVLRLTRDLNSKNEEVRRRAALDLGLFGSGEGSYHLVKRLKKETVAAVVEACSRALVKIGGKKTTEVLAKLASSRKTAHLMGAIALLAEIAGKDPVQGKYAGIALAKFANCADEKAGRKSYETMKELGRDGGGVDGLIEALRSSKVPTQRRRLFIMSLGKMGDPRAAQILGRFFQQKGNRSLRGAAEEAVFDLGIETVPYLIPYLSGNTRIYTGYVLRRLTGQQLKSSPRVWQQWWDRH